MKAPSTREVVVHITSGTLWRALLVIAGVILAWYLRDIILVVLTAVVLASALEPGVKFLVRHNIPRLFSVVMIYFACGSLLGLLVYFFIPAFIDDVTRLAQIIPQLLSDGTFWKPLESGTIAVKSAASMAAPMGVPIAESASAATGEISRMLGFFRTGIEEGGAFQTASMFFGGLLSFVLIVVLSFYLSAQERGIEGFLRLISPVSSRAYVVDLWRRSQQKIGLWFQGQIVLGILVGVLAYLGLTILDVPSAFFLAVTMATFELIPVFGPVLAAVPGVAIAYFEGIRIADPGLTAALIVTGFYFIIQQFESHLFYPLVIRKIIGIPPVLVILALVVGAKVAGFLGVLLSVPLTAVMMEYLGDVAREKRIYEDNA
ncbi:MAG TPA: AI-2E family transporter [Candidatus Paceibacterota bacterium]|nr:AI-2E family transporter [Candidatus Paceibacterota bacterium]